MLLAELGPGDLVLFVLANHGLLGLPLLVQGVLVLVLIGGGVHLGLQVLVVHVLLALLQHPVVNALWFNRGMGPKIQGFISGLFSTVCIDRLCQWESMMATLSPGLKHQCTMEKSQQI